MSEAYAIHKAHQTQESLPGFNACWLLHDLMRTAHLGVFPHDKEDCTVFSPGEEPAPPVKDSWARGAGKSVWAVRSRTHISIFPTLHDLISLPPGAGCSASQV